MSLYRRVYAIEAVGFDAVKIGVSRSPMRRLYTMQIGSFAELRMLRVFRGSAIARDVEQALHRRFSEHRIRGEWFRLSPIRQQLMHARFR